MASASDLTNAVQELELDSECPICLQTFAPPVYQCNNGHVICHDCLPQCTICSICREQMPRDRVRSLQFEKVLIWIANIKIPCPRRGDGCTVRVRKDDVEKHLLECAFVPRRLCLRLGITCFEEQYCTGKRNKLIEHLVFEHKLQGLIEEDDDDNDNQCSSSTLELEQIISLSTVHIEFLNPNFIRFDENIFFIKKYWNLAERLMAIVVCMNEPLETAQKYSSLVQLTPTGDGISAAPMLEFKQKEIVLLTQADEVLDFKRKRNFKYHDVVLCRIPFSTFEYYDVTFGRGRELHYKVRVTVFKNKESSQS